MTVWGIILARKGSKRCPGKNKKILVDKALVAWTLEAACKAQSLDKVIISSDCNDCIKIAKKYGKVEIVMRPESLATDKANAWDAVMHVVNQYSSDELPTYINILQPTSPQRTAEHIDHVSMYAAKNDVRGLSTWSILGGLVLEKVACFHDGEIRKVSEGTAVRSQDGTPLVIENGIAFMVKTLVLLNEDRKQGLGSVPFDGITQYLYPEGGKEQFVDIDTAEDFVIAEAILKHKAEHSN